MNLRTLQTMLVLGNNPYIDIDNTDRVFIHLTEELGECAREHRKGKFVSNEIADILILLCFYASSMGVDLERATQNKIYENIRDGKFKPSLELEALCKNH